MITSDPEFVRPLTAVSVESVELDGGVLVFVEGDIDSETAPDLELALASYSEHRLFIDLTGVDFFDAAAVTVLLSTADRVRGLGGSLRIVAVSSFGRRLLGLLDLSAFFGLDPRMDDATSIVTGVTDPRGDQTVTIGDNDDRSGGSCPTP